ncbi:MAG: hypothetical protein WC356_07800 [Candidatus Micrarchaeia archaeon]|jgi:hypothetical protein
MVKIYEEEMNENFEGTIIDIETIGLFDRNFKDSRQYKQIKTVIFGFVNKNKLGIYSVDEDNNEKLLEEVNKILNILEKPFYAFNSDFERGVLFHNLNKEVAFERELNKEKYESKKNAEKELNIPQYDDPFNGEGILCVTNWLKGDKEKCIKHNRSCLLKEKDIFLKRGFRIPDKLILNNE